ncbi:MAG: type II toxin-antitoxin system VapC family toxin [Steroidobacteraceae bacterium]
MIIVVDASVVVKWLVQDAEREADTDKAQRLMEAVVKGEQPVSQPCHWICEVAAVLSRTSPDTAADDAAMLCALELPLTDEPAVLPRACELAIELKQHVFDTYYHAVALESPDAVLVTADERYLRAGRVKGRIIHLRDWR